MNAPSIRAQARPPEFEVASVRPSVPLPLAAGGGRSGGASAGPRFRTGTTVQGDRVEFAGATLTRLISFAFGILEDRIVGPDWMRSQTFDIEAKLPQGTSGNQVPMMLQTLLADRFKLVVHRGSKELPVYALVVAKGGLKVKESSPDSDVAASDPNAPPPPPCPPQNLNCIASVRNLGGVETRTTPISPTSRALSNSRIGTAIETMGPSYGKMRLEAPNTTLAGLADLLPTYSGKPVVIDMTELKGRYQMVLEISVNVDAMKRWALAQAPRGQADDARGPAGIASDPAATDDPIFDACQNALEKLGLRLEPSKVPLETIVIDHLEKTPTAN
jgi:uncharacterized protein (TIGR03435 family)